MKIRSPFGSDSPKTSPCSSLSNVPPSRTNSMKCRGAFSQRQPIGGLAAKLFRQVAVAVVRPPGKLHHRQLTQGRTTFRGDIACELVRQMNVLTAFPPSA